eukprot:15437475-Alexandrium_andersonii.AAC.1
MAKGVNVASRLRSAARSHSPSTEPMMSAGERGAKGRRPSSMPRPPNRLSVRPRRAGLPNARNQTIFSTSGGSAMSVASKPRRRNSATAPW